MDAHRNFGSRDDRDEVELLRFQTLALHQQVAHTTR